MRVSLTWLKDLVDITLPVEELCDRLDMTGTKVEAVHRLGAALEGVVVGQVITRDQHPDADKLSYCTVDIGKAEPLHIVCGATNFQAGDKVPVACVGATLPNGMSIKKAKLRGLVSKGMMCSATELGVGGDASGLLVLPADAPVGTPFAEYYGIGDTVLELEVTPNRPDCLSMVGVAREVAAVTRTTYREPASTPEESGTPAADLVSVEIADAVLCPRYTARVIRGVTVGPSPAWLAERIVAAGTRPVNNIVDVTNYVMYELGQPLHAFDMRSVAQRDGRAAIIVRPAAAGETIRTLDGQDRILATDTLLITDPSGPIALAGVMGGETTEVSDATIDVLLEAACFNASSTSRTSRRLGLISEASLRFERGMDPDLAARASDRAAALIAEVGGGTVAPGIVDVYPGRPEPKLLHLRTARVNAILGTALTREDIAAFLTPLGLGVTAEGDDLDVVVPAFRPDLEREIDLVEEVARLYGLENIASTRPGGRERVGGRTAAQRFSRRIGEGLRAAGLDEHVGYAFGDRADLVRLGWDLAPDEVLVELINPMSEDQSVLRWTLAPSLLRAVSHNRRRGIADAHIYEMGAVFVTADGRKQPKERTMVGGALTGAWDRPGWNEAGRTLDFFDGKGVLESLFESLHVGRWTVRACERAWLQAGRSAEVIVAGDVVGWLGEVSPEVLDAFEITAPVVLFELSVPSLVKAAARESVAYQEIPRQPAYALDLALVVDEAVTAERVTSAIRSAGGPLLESVRLFDVYRDAPGAEEGQRRLPEGKKSLAFALSYRAADRTLSDDDVRPVHEKLVRKVSGAVGAEVRA
ncbi:MAG: phenylalanine--tRNA ligase subunit beta [Coriobacteriia bacterium]|nr:phenylalanine--tRNA ligase subunit beta [Coriobacteriia bacterium]